MPAFSNSPFAERYTRFDSPRGMRVPSADEISSTSLSSKVTVLYSVTARPSASKPEPMFALVAGTETLIFIAAAPFLIPLSVFFRQTLEHQLHAAAHGFHLAGCFGQCLFVGALHKVSAAS